MDVLLTTFIAALLAEFGDKTQLLVVALAVRYRSSGAVLAGVAAGALANTLLAAFAGSLLNGFVTLRALSLLVAVALVFAGVAGLLRQPDESGMGSTWKTSAFVTSAVCFFLLEFGDKTQFLTLTLAARFDSFSLAAAGATAGVVAASIPAVLLADRFREAIPLKPLRITIAGLFLLVGFIVAVSALRLA